MSKNKLIIIMMTILTASALGGVMAYAQEVDENMVAAETLLSLLEGSEGEVISLFESIVTAGGEVSEDAQEALEEAQQIRAEAQDLFDEGSYLECVQKATEALNKYGKALNKAADDEVEEMDAQVELAEETEKMVGLFTAIEKARARIVKLEEIANDLDAQEIDTSDARGLFAEAEGILVVIEGKLATGGLEQEIILGEANSLIGQATGMLKNKGEPKKLENIHDFIEQTGNHANQLQNKWETIFARRGIPNANAISDEFGAIIAELQDIDTKDDLKDVINQLKDLVKDLKNVGKSHGQGGGPFDDETVEAINAQTKMEALIERYRNQILELEGSEELVAELNGMLDEVEGLLAEAEDALGSEDEDLAEELMDAAEDILDAFDELFDEAKEESEEPEPDSD